MAPIFESRIETGRVGCRHIRLGIRKYRYLKRIKRKMTAINVDGEGDQDGGRV
jgi:hypothetical protein